MSLEAHLKVLNEKHDILDQQVHEAYIHHDEQKMLYLKRERLKIDDEIASIENRLREKLVAEAA